MSFSCQNVQFNNIHLVCKCIRAWEEIWITPTYHKLKFDLAKCWNWSWTLLNMELRVGLCFSLSIWKQYWKWKHIVIIRIKDVPWFLFKAFYPAWKKKKKKENLKKSSLEHTYVYSYADRMGISLYTSKGQTCFWPLKFHSIGYKLRERNSDSPPQNSAMWKKAGKTLWDNRDSTSKQQLPKIESSQCNSNCKELLNDARNRSQSYSSDVIHAMKPFANVLFCRIQSSQSQFSSQRRRRSTENALQQNDSLQQQGDIKAWLIQEVQVPYGDLSIRSNAAATYATSNKKPSVIRHFLICVRSAGIKFHRERCILSYNEVKGKISRYISLLSVKKNKHLSLSSIIFYSIVCH